MEDIRTKTAIMKLRKHPESKLVLFTKRLVNRIKLNRIQDKNFREFVKIIDSLYWQMKNDIREINYKNDKIKKYA